MKNISFFFLFFITLNYAQFSVNGTMTKALNSEWVVLYKIESTKQVFIADTTIKRDSLLVDGKKVAIGTFSFNLPKAAKSGTYRVTYQLQGAGSLDFIFNKENIRFTFNPDYPAATVLYADSKENIIYRQYLEEVAQKQQRLDSIQIAVLRNKVLILDAEYQKAHAALTALQNQFLTRTKGMYVQPFVKASMRNNPLEIIKTPQKYMSNMTTTFFDNLDFSNKTLINSSFLTNRVLDYVFYINYSDDEAIQNNLFRKSITLVLSKIADAKYKKEMIVFLMEKFEASRNLEIIDSLLENDYKKLPKKVQNQEFITAKKKLFSAEIGRIAPDFSWPENGKTIQLSSLKSSDNYLLLFWSTECSHCLIEVPQLYTYLQENKKVKVIAFGMEKNDSKWKKMRLKFPKWQHVLGLNKWENETARTYNINTTPSYFVLGKEKKIIGKPNLLKDLKTFLEKL